MAIAIHDGGGISVFNNKEVKGNNGAQMPISPKNCKKVLCNDLNIYWKKCE
ncbi:MAG: hypothetical protein ACLFR2_00905 [Candidatus Kapaibacterium sp.]